MSLYAQAKCVMIDLRLRSGERLNFCPAINCLFRLTSGDTVLGDAITLLFYFILFSNWHCEYMHCEYIMQKDRSSLWSI